MWPVAAWTRLHDYLELPDVPFVTETRNIINTVAVSSDVMKEGSRFLT